MELVSQVVGTSRATMAVIDSKERTTRPVSCLLKLRLDYVQNDWYSIFVVISNNALVSVSSIWSDNTIPLASKFSRFIWLYKGNNWWIELIHNASASYLILICLIVSSQKDVWCEATRIVVWTLLRQKLSVSISRVWWARIVAASISHRTKLLFNNTVRIWGTLGIIHCAIPAAWCQHALRGFGGMWLRMLLVLASIALITCWLLTSKGPQ